MGQSASAGPGAAETKVANGVQRGSGAFPALTQLCEDGCNWRVPANGCDVTAADLSFRLGGAAFQSGGFRVIDLEECQDPDHLESFGGEGRGAYQPGVSAGFFCLAQSIDDGADAARVDVGHGREVEQQAGMTGGEGSFNGFVELLDPFSVLERTF
jgi:hypothetical protein